MSEDKRAKQTSTGRPQNQGYRLAYVDLQSEMVYRTRAALDQGEGDALLRVLRRLAASSIEEGGVSR